ncbi:recombinase family protein [Gammaproteobacteria bacterium ESL0073]|nr:recombinase family protein [Gammaproteobacteria bacterium ESL0073]
MTQENNQDKLIPAVAYVRMSTDHQECSIENQLDFIYQYAKTYGYKINHLFKDEGKSGLQIKGREQFQALIQLIEKKEINFSAVLVYDVSRWGRFQNINEASHYIYLFEKAGVKVIFCAEPFSREAGLFAKIQAVMKQGMAAEYSRELGDKVFYGQANLIRKGFRQGGPAGFGLRRQLVDHQGVSKGILSPGEHKSIQTDRVILVKGPSEELQVVQCIYRLFVNHGLSEQTIANKLNLQGVLTDRNRCWTRGVVHQILINEKYIGHNVWNRRSFKLKEERTKNSKETWIRANDVFEAIVSKEIFNKAQSIIVARTLRFTDDEILDKLKALYQKKKRLSSIIIDEDESCPSSSVYQNRFGSLLRTYQLIGYTPNRDYRYIEINKLLRARYPVIVNSVIENIQHLGGSVYIDKKTELLVINDEFTVSLILSRCQETKKGRNRWVIRLDTGLTPDISIIVRMCLLGQEIKDYYLLPSSYLETPKFRLMDYQANSLDAFRFNSLDYLYIMAKRLQLKDCV